MARAKLLGLVAALAVFAAACTSDTRIDDQGAATGRSAEPSGSPSGTSDTRPAPLTVVERIAVPFEAQQVMALDGWLWVRGGDRVLRTGVLRQSFRPGLITTGMTKLNRDVWVSFGDGRGAVYSIHSRGPGFPREHAVVRLSGAPRTTRIRVPGPVDLVAHDGRLWVLSLRYQPRRQALVHVDPSSRAGRGSFRAPGEAERLLSVGRTLWLIGPAPRRGARLWPVHETRGLQAPVSIRLPFGSLLTAVDPRHIAIMNSGSNPELRVLNTQTLEVRQVPFSGTQPRGLALRGHQLWVASEQRRIDVVSLQTGQTIARDRLDHPISGLFVAGKRIGAITRHQLILLASKATR